MCRVDPACLDPSSIPTYNQPTHVRFGWGSVPLLLHSEIVAYKN